MPLGPVDVTEVDGRKELARFVELPQALHGHDPRFAPPVMAWERFRLDPRRNPYFERGDAAYLLARQGGRVVGRIAAHVPHDGAEGRFGFWCIADDDRVADALLDRAREWLAHRGCRSMQGPLSFDEGDEPGVRVAGFDVAGRTGLPWHPEWEARRLEAGGGRRTEEQPMWEVPLAGTADRAPVGGSEPPPQAGSYGDPSLVLEDIAAVPDVAGALRSSGLRSAWSLARRARERAWDTAVVVDHPADAAPAVARLAEVAAGRGYQTLVAPWSPAPARPPEVVHARYEFRW
jgi:hypothetical protein